MIYHLCHFLHGKLVKTAKPSGPLHCCSIRSGRHCSYTQLSAKTTKEPWADLLHRHISVYSTDNIFAVILKHEDTALNIKQYFVSQSSQ